MIEESYCMMKHLWILLCDEREEVRIEKTSEEEIAGLEIDTAVYHADKIEFLNEE